jgi:hypothetical protein
MTEPLDDTSYAWLVLPPNVPGQVTPLAVPPPLALRRELTLPSPMARMMSTAEQCRTLLVIATLLVCRSKCRTGQRLESHMNGAKLQWMCFVRSLVFRGREVYRDTLTL